MSARDFIKVDKSSSATDQARKLVSYISTLRAAYNLGSELLAIMGHNNDGTVFTDIESLFGLPAGKGQIVFNLVNGSFGTMNGTFQTADVKNITEQVG